MSSAITVDYTGFDAFPASSPGNWPILKNGVDSTWRESLLEIVAYKAEKAANNNTSTKLHNDWQLNEVAKKWSEVSETHSNYDGYKLRQNALEKFGRIQQSIFRLASS